MRIDGAEREVLGHALHEPKRQAKRSGEFESDRAAPLARDVELKCVHQLVAKDMIGFRQRSRKGENDPKDSLVHSRSRRALRLRPVPWESSVFGRHHMRRQTPLKRSKPKVKLSASQLSTT